MLGETELGSLQRMPLMSSCKPRKMACVVDSIGDFVVDISVVADRNDLSHDATSFIDSQSALLSSKA